MKQVMTVILIVWCSTALGAGEMFAPSSKQMWNFDPEWKITSPSTMKWYAEQYRQKVWMDIGRGIELDWQVKKECAAEVEREVIEHTKDDLDFLLDADRQADAFTTLVAKYCLPPPMTSGRRQPDMVIEIR